MTTVPPNSWNESDQKAIRQQLERIVHSGPFQQSRRRQRFLDYLVNETLAGRSDRLKGYSIALEVFERPETFDPTMYPLVRIEAARLREKLREYYDADGKDDPIRIDLPKGTYTPQIEFRQTEALEPKRDRSEVALEKERAPLEGPVTPVDERPSPLRPRSIRHLRWWAAASALVFILALGAVGAWLARDLWTPALKGVAENQLPTVPKGPAIAVLPFLNLSGDPKQEYFSDGLTDDLMTELSRTSSDLRVLAHNTTFQYKDKAVDVPKLGRDLGARYVLEGSVQRDSDDLRVTAQLIDTETGSHIWADRFDRKMADIFLVQDEIVSQIVAKIAGGYGVIEINEARSARQKTQQEIRAYDLVLRAHEVMLWEWNRANFRSAKEMLLQAIAIDPSNARARRELAYLDVIGWVFRFDDTPVSSQEIVAQAAKAVELDRADARARMVAATAYFFNKQLDLFEREAEQAIALAPYDGEILAVLGHLIAISGEWQRGVALAEKANALNADAAIGWYQVTMYYNFYLKGDYERALEFRRLHPDQHAIYTYIEYIPVYGQLGRKEEALENWRKLLAEDRGWTAESFKNWYHLFNMRDEDIAKMMDGVYKSGVLQGEAKPG